MDNEELKLKIKDLVGTSLPITSMRGLDNKNFVPGKTFIQYSGPTWTSEEIEAAIYTLLKGKWLSAGEEVRKFEKEFSDIIGKKHSLMCNSGSSANLLMFSALKSKRTFGFDSIDVITPAVCFPTTIAPIIQCGFKPKFIDVELDTLNLDLDKFEEAIDSKTKVLVFAHVLGNPPNMDRVKQICDSKGIILLEDSCDALGSTWDNKPLGSFGLMSSCSFYPAHHITTGEGGMVSTDDDQLITTLRSICSWGRGCNCVGATNLLKDGACGRRFSKWLAPHYDKVVDHKYIYEEVGYNLKALDLQGAIGLVQLNKLQNIKINRKNIFNKYFEVCSKYPELVKLVSVSPKADVSWFGFPITVISDKFDKNTFVKYLEDRNIQTRNYFSGNILFHKPYSHLGNPNNYPNACKVMDSTFFIGVHPDMTSEMIDYVRECLDDFLKKYK